MPKSTIYFFLLCAVIIISFVASSPLTNKWLIRSAMQNGDANPDKIIFPDDFGNIPTETSTTSSTTIIPEPVNATSDLDNRFFINAPPNCPTGQRLVGTACRRSF